MNFEKLSGKYGIFHFISNFPVPISINDFTLKLAKIVITESTIFLLRRIFQNLEIELEFRGVHSGILSKVTVPLYKGLKRGVSNF